MSSQIYAGKETCIVENLFGDGAWAVLERRDPPGLRGCGFFHVRGDKIAIQRGYCDKLSFLKLHGVGATGPGLTRGHQAGSVPAGNTI